MEIFKIEKEKALKELKKELVENTIEEVYRGDYGWIEYIIENGLEGLNDLNTEDLKQKYWETFNYMLEDEYENIEIV